jgi:hypothetical protein
MPNTGRRAALGFIVAGVSSLPLPWRAAAYSPDSGQEVAPGVREVHLGSAVVALPGYKIVGMRDLVFQPGTNTYDPSLPNDMICHVTRGLLRVKVGEREWVAKRDIGLWAGVRGSKVSYRNTGADVAVVRIMDLLSA